MRSAKGAKEQKAAKFFGFRFRSRRDGKIWHFHVSVVGSSAALQWRPTPLLSNYPNKVDNNLSRNDAVWFLISIYAACTESVIIRGTDRRNESF